MRIGNKQAAALNLGQREEFECWVRRLAEEPYPSAAPAGAPQILAIVDHAGVLYTLTRQANDRPGGLSHREREIASLVARGLSNKMIAAELDLSIYTVATYLRRIFGKLGVTNRAAMVAAAGSPTV